MSSLCTRPLRVVCGGQTGVDRGALDAALDLGIPCGGWCPQGRQAEDGIIPARYPLTELSGAGYDQRTRKNVEDSDTESVQFVTEGGIAKLNVAGPRASAEPRSYGYSYALVRALCLQSGARSQVTPP